MKRRKFLQGMMASAGAATMPAPAVASAVSKVAAQATTKVIPFHYGWACVYAQMNNGVSAADIERVFRISYKDASGLMDRMLARGVIHPPGLDGRSHPTRAWEPWDKKSPPIKETGEHTSQDRTIHETGHRAREKFQKRIAVLKTEDHYVQAA